MNEPLRECCGKPESECRCEELRTGRSKVNKEEPTQEQLKEFWCLCGWKQDCGVWYAPEKDRPGREYGRACPPTLDLNNLFKWTVPMPWKGNPDVRWIQTVIFDFEKCRILDVLGNEYVGESDDPALALFWAVREMFRG